MDLGANAQHQRAWFPCRDAVDAESADGAWAQGVHALNATRLKWVELLPNEAAIIVINPDASQHELQSQPIAANHRSQHIAAHPRQSRHKQSRR
jgi:hypothetical protein